MGRVKNAVAYEHRMRVLREIGERCGAEGCIASIKDLAAASGLAPSCVRSSLRALIRAGLVRVVHRAYPDGGNAENAYFTTDAGAEALADGEGGCWHGTY